MHLFICLFLPSNNICTWGFELVRLKSCNYVLEKIAYKVLVKMFDYNLFFNEFWRIYLSFLSIKFTFFFFLKWCVLFFFLPFFFFFFFSSAWI